jgi:flavin-dependent dehydrogenase
MTILIAGGGIGGLTLALSLHQIGIAAKRGPDGYTAVTDVLSLKELEDIAANYKRLAGFQVEALNAKPAIVQMPTQ